MLISDYNKSQYQQIYQTQEYGIEGYKWAVEVDKHLSRADAKYVLDYGSGKGTLSDALRDLGYIVSEFEPGIPGKDVPTEEDFDAVVTTDVLEHVEPDYIDDVMQYISDRADTVFAVIATRKAVQVLPDGLNAHPLVRDATWWALKFQDYFTHVYFLRNHPRETVIWGEK